MRRVIALFMAVTTVDLYEMFMKKQCSKSRVMYHISQRSRDRSLPDEGRGSDCKEVRGDENWKGRDTKTLLCIYIAIINMQSGNEDQ